MKRKEYIFVLSMLGILAWRMKIMNEKLNIVADIAGMLLDESYQKDVDEEFEEIVENALDDLNSDED